jgi:ribosomal protein S18 acetylase RimI-like enzyme
VNDLELLAIQAEGAFDDHGRIPGWYGVTVACSKGGQALWVGADVPDAVTTELATTFDPARAWTHPARPPSALELCRRVLDRGGRALTCDGGPSFLIETVPPLRSGLEIARSDQPLRETLRDANPGNWHPVEWSELLEGALGPWAMVSEHGLVVSICHTPRPMTARGAECGVWTHPAFRGRGYAGAVVAEWATILESSGRHRFYSTRADNFASQQVARRLHLHLLGWTWRLGEAQRGEATGVHPLCSLRRPAAPRP